MKALIIGATGATGTDLVQALLEDPEYKQVTIFVRRSSGNAHPKLVEIITDFDLLRKNTDRAGERISCIALKFMNSLGLIRKFSPLPTLTLAQKMAKASKLLSNGKHVIELKKILEL